MKGSNYILYAAAGAALITAAGVLITHGYYWLRAFVASSIVAVVSIFNDDQFRND